MARYRTQPGNGGEWHIYPGGRRVFVRKQAPPRATTNPPLSAAQRQNLNRLQTAYTALPPRQRLKISGGYPKKPPAAPVRRPNPPAATPGTPPPAARPAVNPAPPDPTYDAQVGALNRTYESDVAGIGAGRQRGLLDYGFSETGYNPATGTQGALQFNPNDPFSKAALLKRTYDASRKATGLGMAAGGGLYSGAYQTGQDAVNRGQIGSENTLQKSLVEFLAGNSSDYARAGTDYTTGVAQAGAERLGRVAENPLYEPTSSVASGAAPKLAAKAKPGPKAKPKPQAKPTVFHWPGEKQSRTHTISWQQHQRNLKK